MLPYISQLHVTNIRNLASQELNFDPGFNVMFGANGSGKTSLLEAIHLLSFGRSFRTRSSHKFITLGAESCLARALVHTNSPEYNQDLWLGIEKHIDGNTQYRIGERAEHTIAPISRLLPVQLVDVNSYLLIEGGPIYRRQFLDWGVFHVEHQFFAEWQMMQRALEQRNVGLRQRSGAIDSWTQVFVQHAVRIDKFREQYISEFRQIFIGLLHDIMGWQGIEMNYQRGWSRDDDLGEVLAAAKFNDIAHGYTGFGPQRADLKFSVDGQPIKAIFSRGQIKMFVCIMLLARAYYLNRVQRCVFLLDDLLAELDQDNSAKLVQALMALGCQVFITGTEKARLGGLLVGQCGKMFHVEQGCVRGV